MKLNRYAFVWSLCLCSMPALAQVDTIGKKGNTLLTNRLKPGLNQYLVYTQNPKSSKKLGFWFWLRDIKRENRNGENTITISQQWFSADTLNYRKVFSKNRAANFAPLFHSETVKGVVHAYNWYSDHIKGADTVSNNTKKDFGLDFKLPNLNWNLDIETFEMLPLAAGKKFALNFYDAGLDPPAYVLYQVIGDEILTLYGNKTVDCWKLITQGEHD